MKMEKLVWMKIRYLHDASTASIGGFPSVMMSLLDAEEDLSPLFILLAGLAYLIPLLLNLEGDFYKGVGGFELAHIYVGSTSVESFFASMIISKILFKFKN